MPKPYSEPNDTQVTPEPALEKRTRRQSVQQNPERFVKGRPVIPTPPTTVAINPIVPSDDGSAADDRGNFPTLAAAVYTKSILCLK